MIAANVAWNATNTISGIDDALAERARAIANSPFGESNMPFRNSRSKPPKNALPSVNARL